MRLLLPLAVLAMLALPAASAADGPPQLTGTVGPGFSIGLAGADGAPVTHVEPGTYQLVVHDLADGHNFHLFGPAGSGVDFTTGPDLGFVGDKAATLVLPDGITVNFVCDAHVAMHGSFTVGTVVAALPPTVKPPATTPPKPKPKPKKKPKKKR